MREEHDRGGLALTYQWRRDRDRGKVEGKTLIGMEGKARDLCQKKHILSASIHVWLNLRKQLRCEVQIWWHICYLFNSYDIV